jgi:hypothetical protein
MRFLSSAGISNELRGSYWITLAYDKCFKKRYSPRGGICQGVAKKKSAATLKDMQKKTRKSAAVS